LTNVTPSAFPELRRVFSGYLHEDVLEEHGVPEAALRAFRADASPAERRRFKKEAARFLAQTAALDLDELRHVLHGLGCRWNPPSREALLALLTAATAESDPLI
jgi:contact-dependent growth inhibition (CDI) system CdiI-like immunity protein